MNNDKKASVPESLLMAALRSANDGIVIADARAKDQPLIFVNPAFSSITGYTYEEAVGKNCRFLQGDEREQPGLQTLRVALQKGLECRVTLQNFRKDGTPFWNELHVAPIYEGKELAHFVGVQSDVTARIDAEQLAETLRRKLDEHNRELQILDEQKNQFIGMAAHDLRNPLSHISCTAQLLEQRAARDGSRENAQFLRRIRESADFMADLVDDMLDVSRIESGHMELKREPTDLAELIEQALQVQRHTAAQKKITLTQQAEHGIVMNIDPRKMLQVIDNLTSNAIKYSPEGSEVYLNLKQNQQSALLEVIDQGCGIHPKDQKLIFQPFGRAEDTQTTGGESSTGLGLFISRSIVEAHGGQLMVDSDPGRGSTFTMKLPA